MQLNTRFSKKKLCFFGKFRGVRHLLVVVSALKISKIRCALCGHYKVWLSLLVVGHGCGCSLVYITEYR
jgi:hypothetical protein